LPPAAGRPNRPKRPAWYVHDECVLSCSVEESFLSHKLLTTAEAAHIAGVGASSIKRWADQQVLRCVRTAGGHRRFYREDIEAFMREHGDALVGAAAEWSDIVLRGGSFEIQGQLMRARDRLGAWHAVAGEVAIALGDIGMRWARGEITVIEEHVASENLSRALERAIEAIPSTVDAPRCLLATAEGDEHTLGLSLVELCLREAGWATVWSGRKTPTKALADLARKGDVDMLALSASAASANATDLAREAQELGEACREAGVILILGGSGAWPDTPSYGNRIRDLETLSRLSTTWRASIARRTG
jgi:excisionase family DNA binding protein